MRRLRALLELADGDPITAPWREGLRIQLARLGVFLVVTGLVLGLLAVVILIALMLSSFARLT